MNAVVNKKVEVIDLGLIDYKKAWDYQEEIFKKTVDLKIANRRRAEAEQEPTPNFLVFCQHPHVYTLGKSGKEGHLLLNEQLLKSQGIDYYKINRGGDITYHGPGQLVVYPILDLDNFFTDIHKYLRCLEEAVIKTLADFGVEAGRIEGLTGVWLDFEKRVNPRKICAFGVKSSRWVTMHGLALNVNADISYFQNIIPCGISDKAVTSLHLETGRQVDVHKVKSLLKHHLAGIFEMQIADDEL